MSAGGVGFTYDPAGNLTSAGSSSFTWDWAGRLTTVTGPTGTASYTYDGDGLRVGAQGTLAPPSTYLWDRAAGLPMLVDDGQTSYVNPGQVLEQVPDATTTATYPLADALGSIQTLTDAGGKVVGSASYDVFGRVRASSGMRSVFGFTGEQTDPTGLLFLRARFYDPSTGRFLSPDTLIPSSAGTQGYNLYAYAADDPTTFTDPSGQDAAAETGARYAQIAETVPLVIRQAEEIAAAAWLAWDLTRIAIVAGIGLAVAGVGVAACYLTRCGPFAPPSQVAKPVAPPAVATALEPEPEPPPTNVITIQQPKRCTISLAELPAVTAELEARAQEIHTRARWGPGRIYNQITYRNQTVADLRVRLGDWLCMDILGAGASNNLTQNQKDGLIMGLEKDDATQPTGMHAEIKVLTKSDAEEAVPLVMGISNDVCTPADRYYGGCEFQIRKIRGLGRGEISPDRFSVVWYENLQ